MEKSLAAKLADLSLNPSSRAFILADAKDADMAFGIASPGRDAAGKIRSMADFRDQIRQIVRQGLVDIMLMSASTSEILGIEERLFDRSSVTPAVRANDSTDIHIVRGAGYLHTPSRPFASTTIDHIQSGRYSGARPARIRGANLGLYSVTFNNLPERDLETLQAYKAFRLEAEAKGFAHFLEVFDPNIPASRHGIPAGMIAGFVNDHVVRLLAGVPRASRPIFLKMAYHGPAAMEELCGYDSSLVVGILGGAAGTTHDAFRLLYEAKKYGARAALFGRKINCAEHQLAFVEHLRRVADGDLEPAEAVKSYHGALGKLSIRPSRPLTADLRLTANAGTYASGNARHKRS